MAWQFIAFVPNLTLELFERQFYPALTTRYDAGVPGEATDIYLLTGKHHKRFNDLTSRGLSPDDAYCQVMLAHQANQKKWKKPKPAKRSSGRSSAR